MKTKPGFGSTAVAVRERMMSLSVLLASALLIAAATVAAQPGEPVQTDVRTDEIERRVYTVPLYKSAVIPLRQAIAQVSVGNPGVADILVLRNQQLYVVGKALGTTNVVAWDSNRNVIGAFDVEVTHDLETLKHKLHELLPGENIRVHSAQEKLVMSGQVSTVARVETARELAESFLADCIRAVSDAPGAASRPTSVDPSCKEGGVVNMMQVGGAQQVMLKVTVAEIARNVVKRLDANLNILSFGSHLSGGASAGGAAFPDALDADGLLTPLFGDLTPNSNIIGPPLHLFSPNTPAIDATGAFLSYLDGNFFLEAVLDISKRNGLAKILSEPTLTTLSGQEAQFLSGGEFPIPVPQGGGTGNVTIEFKEFGVGLRFLPLVLDSGHINLTLNISVSDVTTDNSVILRSAGVVNAFVVPSLSTRKASSSIELSDGQTIGIAGLINDNVREFVQKFPGLGDLPLLGALFRSQEFQSGQTELVIFVTPTLAKPIAPNQIRLPTDRFVPPRDYEFYLLGRTDSRHAPPPRKALAGLRIGHDVEREASSPAP